MIYNTYMIRKIIFLLIFIMLASCSSVPKNTQNSCEIFEERYLWYKHARASYKKWGVPIYIQLAFIKKESDFNWLAKPPRVKLFKIIPLNRKVNNFLWVDIFSNFADNTIILEIE